MSFFSFENLILYRHVDISYQIYKRALFTVILIYSKIGLSITEASAQGLITYSALHSKL